jgi:NAD(P)-dependent dehydrogenase (short-subunit alcohol dehydrogenase family)
MKAPLVVVDATGTIGKALVRQFVASGQPVVAVASRLDRLARLRAATAPGDVTPIVGRFGTDTDAQHLAARLRSLARPLAGVVVTSTQRTTDGRLGCGRLLEQPTDVLAQCLEQTLLPQHVLARHLVPLLAESGRNTHYVIVGGPGSETPWAGYGPRSVATAATRMLARVLHDEARTSGVRVQLMSIDSPLRSERPRQHECPEWPTADEVARRVARLIDRRSANDDPADAIVAFPRVYARTAASVSRPYVDVPAFLESLRHPTNKITPQ